MYPQLVQAPPGFAPFQGKSMGNNFQSPVQAPVMFTPTFNPQQSASTSPPTAVPLLAPQQSSTSSVGETPQVQQPAFAPISLMQYQTPQFVPVIQVQTQNGPQFVPVSFVPQDPALSGTPPIPQSFLPDSQIPHPIMQASSSLKRSKSNSSVDGRSSFDGSEISDSGDRHRSGSFSFVRGYSYSDVSVSRDGVGSDYHTSDAEGDSPKIDVDSPDKMFYPTGPGNNVVSGPMTYMPQMTPQMTPQFQAPVLPMKHTRKKSKSEKGDQSYAGVSQRDRTPDFDSQDNNLHRYVDRLHVSKNYQCYHGHSHGERSKKRPTSKERQEELYKTELCNYWINGQKCRFGKRCIFAHGQHELRRPKRKIERSRLRPPFRKQVITTLNKLNASNMDTLCSELLCVTVEEVRDDDKASLHLVKALFNTAIGTPKFQHLYAEFWRKLLSIHPMAQIFATQMMDLCISEYSSPRRKDAGLRAMEWVAQICAKKVLLGEDTVHRILSDMFSDKKNEQNVEYWCKLIEGLKNTVDTSKYFPQLNKMKTKFNSRVRFMIMDLEDLKKRNWVKRQ